MPSTSAAVSPVSRSTADAGVERERGRRSRSPRCAAEPGRRRVGDGDAVLGRVARGDHAAAASRERNTGIGAPRASIQSSSPGVPITMSSLAAPTTVLVNRSPGCSSSSTVTTGIRRRVVDARRRRTLVEEDRHEDRAAPAHRCRHDVLRPARRADGPGRLVPCAAIPAPHDAQLVVEACSEHGLVVVVECVRAEEVDERLVVERRVHGAVLHGVAVGHVACPRRNDPVHLPGGGDRTRCRSKARRATAPRGRGAATHPSARRTGCGCSADPAHPSWC